MASHGQLRTPSARLVRALALVVIAVVAPSCGGGGGSGGGGGAPPGLTVTTTSLVGGTQNTPYFATLSAINGTTPYTWTLAAGALPQGLSLSAAGFILGTPTLPSASSFTVRVGDSAVPQNTAERILSLIISPPPLVITNTSLAAGSLTVFYTQQLLATGGIQPYTWTSTTLPPGLTISPSGRITGTPTLMGSGNVTFTVTDSVGTATNKQLLMTIGPAPTVTISGTFTFDKVPATVTGLNMAGIVQLPIRGCFVGLEDQTNTGVWYSSSFTSATGTYSLPSPQNRNVKLYIYALSSSSAGSITVVDRASGATPKAIWAIATPNIAVTTVNVTASDWNVPDSTRINGAFNIANVVYGIQQTILGVAPSSIFGDATIEMSTSFYAGTSYFQGSTGYIKGHRPINSDDFDDAVIAHEYSHFLQTQFSRSDNLGGSHSPDQIIDPRVAFAEGMATFLGQMFLASPLYIDTSAAGVELLFDAESSPTANQGYWNEVSILKLLWDCADATNESGDSLTLPFSAFWTVFTQDMFAHSFVYLIDFIDSLRARNLASGAAIAGILAKESITYTPGGNPSVPNPWPYFISSNTPINAFLDASIDDQWNLMIAADVFYFSVPSAQQITVTLTHTGEGPSPAAQNYVDFYVFGNNGSIYGGNLYASGISPATGTGYTISKVVSLPASGIYSVVASVSYQYPAAGGDAPVVYSSADYQIRVIY